MICFDETLRCLIADMVETLYATRGIGLAACQVGVHLKVIAMDVSGEAKAPRVFINPTILSRDKIGLVEESCLSVPGTVVDVRRATELRVRAQDVTGASHDSNLEGLSAVCLQHEMDHLEGRLLVDHLPLYKRFMMRSRLG